MKHLYHKVVIPVAAALALMVPRSTAVQPPPVEQPTYLSGPAESVTYRPYELGSAPLERTNDPARAQPHFRTIPSLYHDEDKAVLHYRDDYRRVHDALGIRSSTMAGLVAVESDGDSTKVRESEWAYCLTQTRTIAFVEVRNVVHSDEPRYKLLREKHPELAAFIAPRMQGMATSDWRIMRENTQANIDLGGTYLALQIGETGSVRKGLWRYNGAKTDSLGNPDYEYVDKVLAASRRFRHLDDDVASAAK